MSLGSLVFHIVATSSHLLFVIFNDLRGIGCVVLGVSCAASAVLGDFYNIVVVVVAFAVTDDFFILLLDIPAILAWLLLVIVIDGRGRRLCFLRGRGFACVMEDYDQL